jgi:hypothetical protein
MKCACYKLTFTQRTLELNLVAALAIVAETEMACGWIVEAIARATIVMECVQAIGATPKLLNLLFSIICRGDIK